MSLAGLVRRQGSTATLYQATRTRSLGGSSNLTFAAAATGVKVLLDAPDADVVQRVFGAGTRCDLRATVLKDVALTTDDTPQGFTITDGWRVGEHFDVEQIVDFDQNRAHAHYEVALVRRPEAFV